MPKKPVRILIPRSITIEEFDDRLDHAAGDVLQGGHEEARNRKHWELRSFHFLLAITKIPSSIARYVLEESGITEEDLLRHPDFFPLRYNLVGPIKTSQVSIQLVGEAFYESSRLGQYAVTPEHLLLAMAKRRKGRVAVIMRSLGVSPEDISEKILGYTAPADAPQQIVQRSSQSLQA